MTVKEKKRSRLFSLVRESILVLSVCALGEMLTGTFLESGMSYLPGILVLVPAILQLRGTISGSFSSRISTALHIGTIKPQFRNNTNTFRENIYANLFLTIISPFLAATMSFLVMTIFNVKNIGFFALLVIAISAGFISGIIQIVISIISGILIFNRGLDPDIIVFPLLSVIGDILSILTLILVTNLYLSLLGIDRIIFGILGVLGW